MPKVRVKDLVAHFDLKIASGENGLNRVIETADLSRPGIELAGYFDYYPNDRVQIFGRTELTFIEKLEEEQRQKRLASLFTDETPCMVITRDIDVPQDMIRLSNESGVPILKSAMVTTRFSSHLTNYLERMLAPTTAMHGVLVDIYGVGVLITGNSGVGKSETALEIVKRGHRLVADDSVEIRQEDEDTLVGSSPELIEHLLEIRGLGIINVMTLFGAGSVLNSKKISLNIHLESWDSKKNYDRLGLDEDKIRIIDTNITKITLPVRPGRNLAVIIEVAAMNFRLKRMGMNAAQQFAQKLSQATMVGRNEDLF
ncbi:MAG: HPr(Ser) kinase/phosphatase [Bacillaceae bacterium]